MTLLAATGWAKSDSKALCTLGKEVFVIFYSRIISLVNLGFLIGTQSDISDFFMLPHYILEAKK